MYQFPRTSMNNLSNRQVICVLILFVTHRLCLRHQLCLRCSSAFGFRLLSLTPAFRCRYALVHCRHITGVSSGLFPEDDNDLPPSISRTDVNEIATYFDVLVKKSTQEQQVIFSRGKDRYVGRTTWNDWVNKNYRRWGIFDIAVKAMKDSNCHPHMIMKADQQDTWPDMDVIASLAQQALGLALFGGEGLTSLNMVKPVLRQLVNAILFRTLETLKTSFRRIEKKAVLYREKAEAAHSGELLRTSYQPFVKHLQRSSMPKPKSL
jgi:hypothetical protein